MKRSTALLIVALLGACADVSEVGSAPPESAPEVTSGAQQPSPSISEAVAGGVTATTSTVAASDPEQGSSIPEILPVEASEPLRERLVIHAVGDVGLSSAQHGAFRAEGYEIAWSGLRGLFERDSLTIINLECDPSLLGVARDKPYAFRCDLPALPVMAAAGIEVAGMGNNHSGDFGPEALIDGRDNLEALGIAAIGAGSNLEEANQPAIFDVGGWRIAVVAMSGISGGEAWFAGPAHPGVAPADDGNIRASVRAAAARADIVIVTIHWGAEGLAQPLEADVERARLMIEAGADVVIGHHSHQMQPMEYLEGRPVFWSLGDFVWPVLAWRSEESAVAEIVVEPDGSIRGRLIPAYIVSDGHPVLLGRPDPSLRAIPPGVE